MQNCVNTMDSEAVQLTLILLSDTAILCLQSQSHCTQGYASSSIVIVFPSRAHALLE